VDFAFSDDQAELRAAARRLLAEALPDARLHAAADDPDEPYDRDLWRQLVGLGWVSMADPAAGGTFLDDAVLLEEAGYAVAPLPLLSTVTAQPALAAAGSDPTAPTAVAWAEPGGPAAFDVVREPATVAEDGLLSGEKHDVPDLGAAEQLVVVAAAGRGGAPAGYVTERTEPGGRPKGATYELLPTVDGTRRVGRVVLDGTPADATPDGTLVRMRRRVLAGLALESVGVAQRALDLAARHASQREQFGRPIGSYQAVAHRVADVYVATELARSLAYRAAWYVSASEEGDPDAVAGVDSACAAAKASAGDAGVAATEGLVQVLGGIGMTWEHVAHRLYKRALADRAYAGLPSAHRLALAAQVLDG
jgi:alkylation response protein AidB-like acyl-CoA dehydrogenase